MSFSKEYQSLWCLFLWGKMWSQWRRFLWMPGEFFFQQRPFLPLSLVKLTKMRTENGIPTSIWHWGVMPKNSTLWGRGELVVEDSVEEICLPVSFVLLADLVRKACGRSRTCTLRGESVCWHDRWWLFLILRSCCHIQLGPIGRYTVGILRFTLSVHCSLMALAQFGTEPSYLFREWTSELQPEGFRAWNPLLKPQCKSQRACWEPSLPAALVFLWLVYSGL